MPTAGDYAIFARWTAAADRATDATYTVSHAAGVATVAVNQRQNGGLWVSLGTYPLDAGTVNSISLENSPTGTVVADAIRLIAAGGAGAGGEVAYIHTDHLGTPQKMTDGGGFLIWDRVALPFGTTHTENGLGGGTALRFPGQLWDAETGYHYNTFRDYDPSTGRYLQPDPIGLAGGLNRYAYVGANPLRHIDRLGLYPGEKYVDYAAGAVGGTADFAQAYWDMLDATYWTGRSHNGWAGQDAYFHCRANCEAAQRGQGGEDVAQCISDAREWADQLMGDPPSASIADQIANRFGRAQGAANPTGDCRKLCGRYRPGGSFPF